MRGSKAAIIMGVVALAMVLVVPGAAAADLSISSRDMVKVMGDVLVPEGHRVQGSAVAVFGRTVINGQVDGNAVAVFGDVTIGPDAVVSGDAVAVFGRLEIEPGAQVLGSRVEVLGDSGLSLSTVRLPSLRRVVRFDPLGRLPGLIFSLLSTIIVVLLFPGAVSRVKSGIEDEPAVSALVGLVAYAAAAPLVILSAITIIGIPLAILIGFGLWAGRLLGFTAITLMIGERLIGRRENSASGTLGAVIVGVLLLAIIAAVPLAGLVVSLGVSLVALGGAALTRFGARRQVA